MDNMKLAVSVDEICALFGKLSITEKQNFDEKVDYYFIKFIVIYIMLTYFIYYKTILERKSNTNSKGKQTALCNGFNYEHAN